jgi:hypothetical protein
MNMINSSSGLDLTSKIIELQSYEDKVVDIKEGGSFFKWLPVSFIKMKASNLLSSLKKDTDLSYLLRKRMFTCCSSKNLEFLKENSTYLDSISKDVQQAAGRIFSGEQRSSSIAVQHSIGTVSSISDDIRPKIYELSVKLEELDKAFKNKDYEQVLSLGKDIGKLEAEIKPNKNLSVLSENLIDSHGFEKKVLKSAKAVTGEQASKLGALHQKNLEFQGLIKKGDFKEAVKLGHNIARWKNEVLGESPGKSLQFVVNNLVKPGEFESGFKKAISSSWSKSLEEVKKNPEASFDEMESFFIDCEKRSEKKGAYKFLSPEANQELTKKSEGVKRKFCDLSLNVSKKSLGEIKSKVNAGKPLEVSDFKTVMFLTMSLDKSDEMPVIGSGTASSTYFRVDDKEGRSKFETEMKDFFKGMGESEEAGSLTFMSGLRNLVLDGDSSLNGDISGVIADLNEEFEVDSSSASSSIPHFSDFKAIADFILEVSQTDKYVDKVSTAIIELEGKDTFTEEDVTKLGKNLSNLDGVKGKLDSLKQYVTSNPTTASFWKPVIQHLEVRLEILKTDEFKSSLQAVSENLTLQSNIIETEGKLIKSRVVNVDKKVSSQLTHLEVISGSKIKGLDSSAVGSLERQLQRARTAQGNTDSEVELDDVGKLKEQLQKMKNKLNHGNINIRPPAKKVLEKVNQAITDLQRKKTSLEKNISSLDRKFTANQSHLETSVNEGQTRLEDGEGQATQLENLEEEAASLRSEFSISLEEVKDSGDLSDLKDIIRFKNMLGRGLENIQKLEEKKLGEGNLSSKISKEVLLNYIKGDTNFPSIRPETKTQLMALFSKMAVKDSSLDVATFFTQIEREIDRFNDFKQVINDLNPDDLISEEDIAIIRGASSANSFDSINEYVAKCKALIPLNQGISSKDVEVEGVENSRFSLLKSTSKSSGEEANGLGRGMMFLRGGAKIIGEGARAMKKEASSAIEKGTRVVKERASSAIERGTKVMKEGASSAIGSRGNRLSKELEEARAQVQELDLMLEHLEGLRSEGFENIEKEYRDNSDDNRSLVSDENHKESVLAPLQAKLSAITTAFTV